MKKLFIHSIFTLVIITTAIAQQSKIRKGPYLLYPGDNTQMTVLWQLDSSITCQLKWGTTISCLDDSVTTNETGSGTDEHQHIYTITNLIPNQKYYYQITENSVNHSGSFLSAPLNDATSVKFLIYGDTRTYPESQDIVTARMLYEINADTSFQTILLHCGDWTSNDNENSWDSEFFNRNYSNNLEIQSILAIQGTRGNHEGNAVQYNKYWPYPYDTSGNYYSFDYGPVHISVVDQYTDYSVGSAQLNWLENDLASSNKIWKFILLHEPGYTDESRHSNNTDVQNIIQPLCLQYNIKAVFAGHNHYYAHCLVDSVHHLTLGGGGAPIYNTSHSGEGLIISESSLHFATISVNSDSVNIKIVRPDGSVIETFSISADFAFLNNLLNKNEKIKIYTTPANKMLIIEIENYDGSTMDIFNSSGQVIFNKELKNKKTTIELSNFSDGIYFVKIKSGESSKIEKIIIY